MAESTVLATTASRMIRCSASTFAATRAGGGATVIDPTGTNPDYLMAVRYDLTASHWLYRSFLFFDLSSFASGGGIEGDVTLQLRCYSKDYGDTSYPNVVVCEGKQSDTVVTGDWATQTAETENHGELSVNSFTADAYGSITLDASGKALVVAALGGTLKICLMDERDNEDVGAISVRNHGIYYWMTDKGSGYEPKLVFSAYSRVYPTEALTRVTGIRHVYRPGFFRMLVSLGDVSNTIEIAEHKVRRELPLPEYPTEPKAPPWAEPAKITYEPTPKPPAPAPEPPRPIVTRPALPGIVVGITEIEEEGPFAGWPKIPEAKGPVPTYPKVRDIIRETWRGLTPWKEEEAETFGDWIRRMFRFW